MSPPRHGRARPGHPRGYAPGPTTWMPGSSPGITAEGNEARESQRQDSLMPTQKSAVPLLDREICERARITRDRRYDGVFFTAVRTTGIYCRPICPVHPARPKNVIFFRTAAEAEQAGFRP